MLDRDHLRRHEIHPPGDFWTGTRAPRQPDWLSSNLMPRACEGRADTKQARRQLPVAGPVGIYEYGSRYRRRRLRLRLTRTSSIKVMNGVTTAPQMLLP